MIIERSVPVPEWLCAEVAEWVRTAVRCTGRYPSAEVLRLIADMDALGIAFRHTESATTRSIDGWVPLADAARQAGISDRAMRQRAETGKIAARKDRGRWVVRLPLAPR